MKKSVLFVCYGNACRSIMAEALARHHWGEKLEVASAGVSALGYIPEETIKVLDEVGVSTDGLYSKGLNEVDIDGCPPDLGSCPLPFRRYDLPFF